MPPYRLAMPTSQIEEHMTSKDSWGRTVVAHAVLSGRPQVFDAVFDALRQEIRDAEVIRPTHASERMDLRASRTDPATNAYNLGPAGVRDSLRLREGMQHVVVVLLLLLLQCRCARLAVA